VRGEIAAHSFERVGQGRRDGVLVGAFQSEREEEIRD
jgi:hypothetical protein